MLNDILDSLSHTDLHKNDLWMNESFNILLENVTYKDDIYLENNQLIDILCLFELSEIAYIIFDESDVNIEDRLGDYLTIINDFEIDFYKFILLGGEDFITSDYHSDFYEENDRNLFNYLIHNRYDNVVKVLKQHYSSNQTMLESIIKDTPMYSDYQSAIENIDSFEDVFDYVEIMKLTEWSENGFPIYGN